MELKMTSYNNIERRRSQRASFPFEIWYKDRNKTNQGFKHAYGINISEHGLLFKTFESFPPCTILEIRLELPEPETAGIKMDRKTEQDLLNASSEENHPVSPQNKNYKISYNLLAEVVRSEEIKRQWLYHIGLSFCKISDPCRLLIKNYVFSQLGKQQETNQPNFDEGNIGAEQKIINVV